MQIAEERLPVRDLESNLSTKTPHAGSQFVATDTGAVYDGDGTNWNLATREFAEVATASISGPVTGDLPLTSLTGAGLSIEAGELTASGEGEASTQTGQLGTLTGGSGSQTFDIQGVSTDTGVEIQNVSLSVSTAPTGVVYGYNYDWVPVWDPTNAHWDLSITVNWNPDPGAGNDATFNYSITTSP